jgi:hypothetical protein
MCKYSEEVELFLALQDIFHMRAVHIGMAQEICRKLKISGGDDESLGGWCRGGRESDPYLSRFTMNKTRRTDCRFE